MHYLPLFTCVCQGDVIQYLWILFLQNVRATPGNYEWHDKPNMTEQMCRLHNVSLYEINDNG
jgi:hypothetical protein